MRRDERATGSVQDQEALDFLHKGRDLRGLSPLQFRRIEARLAAPARRRVHRRWLPALAALVVVLVAGSALARIVDVSRLPLLGALFPSRTHAPAPRSPRAHPAPASPQLPLPEKALLPLPATETAPVLPAPLPPSPEATAPAKSVTPRKVAISATPSSENRRSSSRDALAPLAAPSPPSDSATHLPPIPKAVHSTAEANPEDLRPVALPEAHTPAPTPKPRPAAPMARAPRPSLVEDVSESQSFSAALELWHRDRAATAALAALDAHEGRFPHGLMQLEAALLRVQIALHQGHEEQALAQLDRLVLQGLPRARELQTVRGELRIKHGRCAEGRADLAPILNQDRADALARRAARALALCP